LSDADGYFVVLLPASTTSATVVVTYSAEQIDSNAELLDISVASPTGDISETQSLDLIPVAVGTGDLQISVSWNTPTDVDLHLIEPNGEEISFGNITSAAGGMLDLDSNPACSIDGVNNENITYEGITPPQGEYIVVVDYFSACGVGLPTDFLVTVRANGNTETFPGSLQGDDIIEVTRFIVQ
jgi:hypothetical protein